MALFQLIYELRKNCCGWTGGRTGIEGSIRGPRGPKNCLDFLHVQSQLLAVVTRRVSLKNDKPDSNSHILT